MNDTLKVLHTRLLWLDIQPIRFRRTHQNVSVYILNQNERQESRTYRTESDRQTVKIYHRSTGPATFKG
jgi:hypothetical protein